MTDAIAELIKQRNEALDECERLRQHIPGPDTVFVDGDWLDHNMRLVYRGERTLVSLYDEFQAGWRRKIPMPECLPDRLVREAATS